MKRLPACLLALALTMIAGVAAATPPAIAPPVAPAPDDAEEAAPAPGVRTLDAVVVSGVQPGPGLWRIEHDGHVMWLLATVSPLPRRMEWNAEEVERRIRESGVVVLPPRAELKAEGMMFGGVFLIPAMLKARNNPDGELLVDVLPAEDYARWQKLKTQYLGRDRGVEKRRPILAALDLREAAFEKHDLSTREIVYNVIERAAKRADVPRQQTSIELVVSDAKAALKKFTGSTLDDLPCFRRTLAQVERDLDTLALRANAWAMGDVAALQALPYTNNAQACLDAMLGNGLARDTGIADLPVRLQAAWLADMEQALAEHPQSFAVLPLSLVTGPKAWLPTLQERGYVVHTPEEADAGGEEAAGEAPDSPVSPPPED